MYQKISIVKIIRHEDNPNDMGEEDIVKLARLIEEQKHYPPLIVNHRDGKYILIDGHQRRKALKTLGHTMIDCDVWTITKEQELACLNTLNNLKGKDVTKRKEALFKKLSETVSKDKLLCVTAEKEKYISSVYDIKKAKQKAVVEANNKTGFNKEILIPFVQRLTRQEIATLNNFIVYHFPTHGKDNVIVGIVKKCIELQKLLVKSA